MLTKMRKMMQRSCNDAPKVLNDGLMIDAAELRKKKNGNG